MVYAILHTISKGKELWFCGRIHVSTHSHGKILDFVPFLNSNIHKNSYTVVKRPPMCLLKLF